MSDWFSLLGDVLGVFVGILGYERVQRALAKRRAQCLRTGSSWLGCRVKLNDGVPSTNAPPCRMGVVVLDTDFPHVDLRRPQPKDGCLVLHDTFPRGPYGWGKNELELLAGGTRP